MSAFFASLAGKIVFTGAGAAFIIGILTKKASNENLEKWIGPPLEKLGKAVSSWGNTKFGKFFYEKIEDWFENTVVVVAKIAYEYFCIRGLDFDDVQLKDKAQEPPTEKPK